MKDPIDQLRKLSVLNFTFDESEKYAFHFLDINISFDSFDDFDLFDPNGILNTSIYVKDIDKNLNTNITYPLN